ncbi:MAG: PIN domain-containing protein [Candidatus Acidiferrales bacterium]
MDSSVLVASERQGRNARQMLASLSDLESNTDVGISVVSLVELAHGAHRANTPERRERRQHFIDELLGVIPIYDVTLAIALRAGQIDGANQARRIRVPLVDLLIVVTALNLGSGLATAIVRHFAQVGQQSIVKI